LLKNQAIDGKEVGKSSIDILGAKSEQKKVGVRPKSRKICRCPKQKLNQYAQSVYQSCKKTSYKSLV
jgi:hypothetical protein